MTTLVTVVVSVVFAFIIFIALNKIIDSIKKGMPEESEEITETEPGEIVEIPEGDDWHGRHLEGE